MIEFLITFLIILISITGLALGVFFGRGPIKGSCGGIACIKSLRCGLCRNNKQEEKGKA